jgi:hypothetical protein
VLQLLRVGPLDCKVDSGVLQVVVEVLRAYSSRLGRPSAAGSARSMLAGWTAVVPVLEVTAQLIQINQLVSRLWHVGDGIPVSAAYPDGTYSDSESAPLFSQCDGRR